MIDGLKLTMTGEELRQLLDTRIGDHREEMARWQRERERTPDDYSDEYPLLPDHLCENEAEEHEWRAEVLAFVRDHIEQGEVYRLGQADLEFAELLPPKPGWMEQSEFEEQTRVGFALERIAKHAGDVGWAGYALAGASATAGEE